MEGGNYSKKVRFFFLKKDFEILGGTDRSRRRLKGEVFTALSEKKNHIRKKVYNFFFLADPTGIGAAKKKSQVDRTFFSPTTNEVRFFWGIILAGPIDFGAAPPKKSGPHYFLSGSIPERPGEEWAVGGRDSFA